MNKDNDILDELRELSPLLFEMKGEGSQPFRVPDGYFESLKADVFTYIDSGLADQVETSSFRVPENYFETLTDNIMAAVESEEIGAGKNEGARIINLKDVRRREPIPVRRWTSMAAAVALFILLGVISARFIQGRQIDPAETQISSADAFEYLEENMMSVDSDDLFAMVDFSNEDISLDAVNDLEDELHQYLEDNIEDLEDYLLTVEI